MAGTAAEELKILHVIDTLNPGGAERMLVTAAGIFHRRGHSADVLTIVKPGPLAAEVLPGIKIINLGRKRRFDPVSMLKLSRICSSYDLVHVHLHYNVVYVLLCRLIFPFKARLVFHEHLGEVHKRELTWQLRVALNSSWFIGVSRNICDWAIDKAGVPSKKVFLLPNTVIRQHAAVRPASDNKLRIVTVSNILRNKQIHLAIEILNKLDKDAELDVYGSTTDEAYFSELQELISRYSLSDRVRFIHNCTDIQSVLPGYKIGLHTSRSESGPLVLIEYLSQGLPFITYDTGEVAGQVRADLPEFIMSSFDIMEWVSRIASVAAQDAGQLKVRLAKVFDKYFSEETYYTKCLNIYRTVLTS
jgi:glycosyltransferase involved in cell wall biosynthesis